MKVVYERLPSKRIKCIATIGVFDGIHLGHQFILKKVKEESEEKTLASLAITFDILPQQFLYENLTYTGRHPRKCFRGYITDFEQKKEFIKLIGIDYLWFLKTNKHLLELSALDFIDHIFKYFDIKKIIIGEDFRFGYEGKGDVEFLKKLSKKYNFTVRVLKKKTKNKKVISSSMIRGLIKEGNLKETRINLSRNFILKGKVIKGKGVGSKLGFPTANIAPSHYILPSVGVYSAYVVVGKKKYLAAVNIGSRPTLVNFGEVLLEVHIIDFKINILGKIVKIFFIDRIRNEHNFKTLDRLKSAIAQDVNHIISKYSTLPL